MLRPIWICLLLLGWSITPVGAASGVPPSDASISASAPVPVSERAADTLQLRELEERAVERDPGRRQLALQETLADIRDRSIEASWYPSLNLRGEATYQTEVPEVGSLGPRSGATVPSPPRDQYQIAAEVTQLLWDGERSDRRRTLNRRRLAEEQAAALSSLYDLRAAVDRAFFGALIAQERAAQLRVLARDLRARKMLVDSRVRAGAALESETAALEAELIEVRQRVAEAETVRRAAIAVLEDLTGRRIEAGTHLAVPDLTSETRAIARTVEARAARSSGDPDFTRYGDHARDTTGRAPIEELVDRPEVRRLRRTERRLEAEARLAETADRPRVQTFLRGAIARPGLDFFDEDFGPFAVAGLRVNWSAWEWGQSDREARSLRLQSEIASSRRASIVQGIERETFDVLYEIDRLEAALEDDARIIELRASVEETARSRLDRGVILPTQYVDFRTELFRARLDRRRHEVELARNRVRLLRVLGRPIDDRRDGGLVWPIGDSDSTGSEPLEFDRAAPVNR